MDKAPLIYNVLSGNANESEMSALKELLNRDPEAFNDYSDLKYIIEQADSSNKTRDDAWAEIQGFIKVSQARQKKTRQRIKFLFVGFAIILGVILTNEFGAPATKGADTSYTGFGGDIKQNIVFQDALVASVLDTIKAQTGFSFSIKESRVLDCSFTGTFYKGAHADEMIRTLSKAIGSQYLLVRPNHYELSGSVACNTQ